ncbi:MAG TPA: Calx-beta domain-containing protein, partial [Kofleriaceae bacterium]|nr:Calx-beta domain-containing protein [Kofleriaceae bacterium]
MSSPTGGSTTEGGGSVTFTVALTSKPPRTVGVPIVSSDATEGKPMVARLLFTPENFDAPQTVTIVGQDDFEADGTVPYKITVGATQGVDYEGLSSEISLTNTDNDTSGITLSAAAGDVTEEGATTTFTAVLNAIPSEPVTLTLASQDTTEGTIAPTSLVFTPENWNAPQVVTVTGVDDNLKDGPQTFNVAVTAITSADPRYSTAALPAPVSVLCIDDDTAGFIVTDATGPTGENGDQAQFTVRLTTEPIADVTVNYASNDATEGVATTNSLTFTAANWNAPQTVTVTGQNDNVADGNQPYKIVFAATTSTDANYSPIKPADVDLLNLDDETAGILVEQGPHNTVEDGSSASFSVVLQSEPTGDVVIGYATSDATEGVANGTSLTFTAANWNAPQTITVVGKDDFVADGNQPYRIDFAAGVSSDANYNGMFAAGATMIN